MESEGPYRIDAYQACEPFPRLIAVGPSIRFGENGIPPRPGELVDLLNTAYSEGRKSAEKDFNEILDLSKSLYVDVCAVYRNAPQSVRDFNTWKKARGIE